MSSDVTCATCAHLEERVSRRWFWCELTHEWTSLATSCEEHTPLLPAELPPPLPSYVKRTYRRQRKGQPKSSS